jgi:hypothetical protein
MSQLFQFFTFFWMKKNTILVESHPSAGHQGTGAPASTPSQGGEGPGHI